MKHEPSRLSSNLGKTSAGLAVAVLLAVLASGGTYALWRVEQPLPGAVITAGNAALDLTDPTTLATQQQLYPGQTVSGEFIAHNTGTVPLALRVDSLTGPATAADPAGQAFADALSVHVWAVTGTGCDITPPPGAWVGTVSSAPGGLGVTVEPDAVQPMCLAATLAVEAPSATQGGSVDLQLTLGGVQQ